MTGITVSAPADQAELDAFVPVHRRTYLMSPEDGEAWAGWLERDNFRICKRDGRPIGGMNLVPLGQWFGGRSVPMTGISSVGIEPAERAGGAGTTFMSEILRELHASGVPISTLYPATQTVYRRCGYELAGDNIRYRLDTDHADVRDRTLQVEHTDDHEVIKQLYIERSRRTAGPLDRSDRFWQRIFDPWKRGPADRYVVVGPNGPEGYVVYTRASGEAVRGHAYADVVALTGAAARRIVTFVADHRSFIETFNWNGAPADPLVFQLAEPRRKVTLSWPWMLRIVDVRRALSERGYPAGLEAELHLQVADDLLSANDGAFVLRVSGGKAEVETGGDGRLRIDIRGLAPLYTGYTTARELISTGYIEASDDDLAAADAIFAGPAPWLADFF